MPEYYPAVPMRGYVVMERLAQKYAAEMLADHEHELRNDKTERHRFLAQLRFRAVELTALVEGLKTRPNNGQYAEEEFYKKRGT
jgi:hypothetical protein